MSGATHIPPISVQYAGDSSAGASNGQHVVGSQNRRSRVSLTYKDLTPGSWCELSFQMSWHPAEESHGAHDFASVGVTFLAADGSNIDFGNIPGLTRTQIDPFSTDLAGPAGLAQGPGTMRTALVRRTFFLPAPAQQIIVTLRSWRNSHPFQVEQPSLRQFAGSDSSGRDQDAASPSAGSGRHDGMRRLWRSLSAQPAWFSYALVPGHRLFVRGQVVNESAGPEGALVRVVFRDASGAVLPPPYPETFATPAIGAFLNIPMHTRARRFTLELLPPPNAARVDLGFQTPADGAQMGLFTPLETSLDERFLLENLSGDAAPDGRGFLRSVLFQLADVASAPMPTGGDALSLLDRSAGPPIGIHQRLRALQNGDRGPAEPGQLQLASFPPWTLPKEPSWCEDPFQSPAWRLEYQSLSWLLDCAGKTEFGNLKNARDLAVSWSNANVWNRPEDSIASTPSCLAVRTEVFLGLLTTDNTLEKRAHDTQEALLGEVLRHCFALSEILGQNTFSQPVEQIHAAGSLLVAAGALAGFPLAGYWASVALSHLRDGFDEVLDQDGTSTEPSQHSRLEILTIGLILHGLLLEMPDASEFGRSLTSRLKEAALVAVSLTDPAGMLPPFGDLPPGRHHASWIKRLVFDHGQDIVADKRLRAELSYPPGPRILGSAEAGVIAARNYQDRRKWGYFCTQISEYPHSPGHFDSTSFTFATNGVTWVADPGGSQLYQTPSAAEYTASSRAHNVALPDGREQTAGTVCLRSRTSLGGASLLELGSNVHGPDYAHRRLFVVLEDLSALAVFDRFTTGERPLRLEGYLHFHPEIAASILSARAIVAFKGQRKLRIVPHAVAGRLSGLEIIHGRDSGPGPMQGFVSQDAGHLAPAGVLRYTFAGERSVCGGVLIATDGPSLRALSDIVATPIVAALLNPEAPS